MRGAALVLGLLVSALGAGAEPPGRCVDAVDPFIGTRGMGHTYPGATVPFGMVQLSPDTEVPPYSLDGRTYNPAAYRSCAGYQYDDPTILGFSHTHFHGTGHGDLGDFLVTPTVGPLKLEPGRAEAPGSGYRSRYDKASEQAKPGYYRVHLSDAGVTAELTATGRVGIHRYTFPASDQARLVLDLAHGIYNYPGKVLWSRAVVRGPRLITGFRHTRGWARDRQLYFALAFSKPFESWGGRDGETVPYRGFWRKWDTTRNFPELAGRDLRLHVDFATRAGEAVVVKVALSAVSEEGALRNLEAEAPHDDFDRYRQAASERWERELSRVAFAGDRTARRLFYTALYHTLLSPVEYQDVDGAYRGLDRAIHRAEGFTNHTLFSLWDTFRAQHPLLTLIQPGRNRDMVRSMLAHHAQSPWKLLPVWSFYGNETWCMIGAHGVPVVADAWLKGLPGVDGAAAFAAVKDSLTHPGYDGLGEYERLGWVPDERQSSSASKTLEFAYDDWAAARMAEALGLAAEAERFGRRARSARNLWDPATGFMRARRADGGWRAPFDPLQTHDQGYIEGNAWNYTFYMPHDTAWLVRAMGGEAAFAARLDQLFTLHLDDRFFAQTEDLARVSMMGTYAHGNEPSHHVPYLYAWAGMPWKVQERVWEIRSLMYRDAPDGLCGNDDCGQMSAWYVFAMLGFYPVCPGSGEYVLGVPGSREMALELEGGRRFVIRAPNLDERNRYIQAVRLNGRPWNRAVLRHADVVQGGELVFELGPRPNRRWAAGPEARPYSLPLDP